MLGHFGFSYVGLIYLVMLFTPNLLWSRNQPENYDAARENRVLLCFERVGQVCCTCSVLIFRDFNITAWSAWSLWLVVSFLLMALYELCWVCYFTHAHTQANIYHGFCGIPLPLASLPVAAFLLLGVYGRVVWLIASVLVLGIGHLGIHMQHLRQLQAGSAEKGK